jgi:hypothetical protein
VHVLPLQHPVQPLFASQTHVPPLHRWPAPHAAWRPHLHVPLAQLSATGMLAFGLQVLHVLPPVPQLVLDSAA